MGFAWFQLRDAQVTEHEVAVQILATDKDPGEVEEIGQGAPPATAEFPPHKSRPSAKAPAPRARDMVVIRLSLRAT